MKKATSLLLCLALAIALPNAVALTGGDFEYEVKKDGAAALTRYLGTAAEPEIPRLLDGHPFTLIGEGAFRDCGFVKETMLPDGVETIGAQAFYNCAALETVTFPVLCSRKGRSTSANSPSATAQALQAR
jgi:hypothetical protein